jgi:sarcosine oxidase subunit gamma
VLPIVPNTARRAQALLALWTGPRSWLLIESAASGRPEALVDFDAKRDALNRAGSALFDVCASRVAFTIRGARAARVLASGCPLDFDVRVFPPGSCAQSVFGRVSALYYRHQTTPGFSVMVARSLAADVWHALCVGASSEGYDVAPPAAFDAS